MPDSVQVDRCAKLLRGLNTMLAADGVATFLSDDEGEAHDDGATPCTSTDVPHDDGATPCTRTDVPPPFFGLRKHELAAKGTAHRCRIEFVPKQMLQ